MGTTNCCHTNESKTKGLWRGLAAGLIPHSFCLFFIVLSAIGAAGASALVKNILLIPNIFTVLIVISILFATISAWLYLKKTKQFCFRGIKEKWRYLSLLFSTTLATNLLLILVVFPAAAKFQSETIETIGQANTMSLIVDIPCSGHAALIIDELKKETGINAIEFEFPSTFNVAYDPAQTSTEKIRSLEIFETFNLTN
ncbi:MAG: hypothetical protein UW63_C0058G0006 [Candidatus Uhrbacteria bacterium GW2011_GWF2_44_350]|uniref:Uncharacterized protein n=1 Tax=Candidatus Uhrbacteria bacterium GW2011_GWF2_44_350 TaxID=1619000 RepID=A0A0G1JCU5_9BACT|nr:MAG: hypothetical protein UW63_C0058G0006 [Candidatus Uhrbacteria bacterium GW2011_GWF2_44_350]HBR80587.1 hypothetical protein [Candidatus Uhrbacteria bacterium]HCU32112.1 hypothetical protein [Candidatus Uhrbacteria bacterium]